LSKKPATKTRLGVIDEEVGTRSVIADIVNVKVEFIGAGKTCVG
jgi:hypothetical protein